MRREIITDAGDTVAIDAAAGRIVLRVVMGGIERVVPLTQSQWSRLIAPDSRDVHLPTGAATTEAGIA